MRTLWMVLSFLSLLALATGRAQAKRIETEPTAAGEAGSEAIADASDEKVEEASLVGDLSADYAYVSEGGQEYNAFEIRRAELGVLRDHPSQRFGGEILMEAIRSAGPNSFSGIDRDSLLFRLKRAWGYGRTDLGPLYLEGRFGLAPVPWVDMAEREARIRFLEQLTAQRQGVYFGSDQGAVVRLTALESRIEASVGVFNGEGRNQIEQNQGKNSQFLLSGTALEANVMGKPLALRLHAGGQEGSFGTGAAANHRFSFGANLLHPSVSGGVALHLLYGVGEVSSREARVVGAWLRASYEKLQVIVRYDHHKQDLNRPLTSAHLLVAGVFYVEPVDAGVARLGIGTRVEEVGDNASPVPGYADAGSIRAALVMFSLGLRD